MHSKPSIEPWIETYNGTHFYFLEPKAEEIDIEDIAHALGMTCRYTGHVKHFYSVAEHCVHVSYLAKNPLEGLLHDASEAYITDIASPIKQYLHDYHKIEDGIMKTIAIKYGISWPISKDTKDADTAQLKTEARHLLKSKGKAWLHVFPTERTKGIVPRCWSPDEAKMRYLERFYQIMEERNVGEAA